MATVRFPIVGPTYTNRSLPVSSQITRNFYIEVNPQGNELVSLMPFPGLPLFATAGNGVNRGTGTFKDIFYTISGSGLFSVNRGGVATLIGTIPGSGRCNLQSDGNNLVIATGESKPLAWDGTTLTQGTDVDLPNASTVVYLNRRVIYDGNNTDVAFADLDDPLSVNSANVTQTDTHPDNMLAGFSHQQQYFACCQESIEPYFNSGVGNPPYTLVTNSVKEIGIHAIHSIGQNKQFTYFLGSDLTPYRLSGLTLQPIGNPAIGQAISKYRDASDAYGMCFTLDEQEFYLISFPIGNETWLYGEESGLWTNLAFGTDGSQHLISSHEFIYDKHLVADRRNSNIYELDFDTFTDNGDTIQHIRDTITVDGETFGRPDARVFMDRLRLRIEPGTSLVSAASQMIMQYSDDNGQTFSSERFASVGDQGEYGWIVEWLDLGMFYRRMFRFTMSDDIKWVLISASTDVELDIG